MAKTKAQPVMRKMSIADAVSEAFDEISSLAEEMRSWADNMEEKFSSTEKYSQVSEAADTLENAQEPNDYPAFAQSQQIEFSDLPSRKRGYSRSDRCGQACYILQACADELDERIEELGDGDESVTLSEFRDELTNVKDEVEGVEFPGMFG